MLNGPFLVSTFTSSQNVGRGATLTEIGEERKEESGQPKALSGITRGSKVHGLEKRIEKDRRLTDDASKVECWVETR